MGGLSTAVVVTDDPSPVPTLAELVAELQAIHGPELTAYRTLAGEYLLAMTMSEAAVDFMLSMWFVAADNDTIWQFQRVFLDRQMLNRKLGMLRAALGAVAKDPDVADVLKTYDQARLLRNNIAHEVPTVESETISFTDGTSLTVEVMRSRLSEAYMLGQRLLDVLVPHLIAQRRRWGASDVVELDRTMMRRAMEEFAADDDAEAQP